MGGRTGGTFTGKDSEAAAAIRLDFPVARSPTTTTRTLLRMEELGPPGIIVVQLWRSRGIKMEFRRSNANSC